MNNIHGCKRAAYSPRSDTSCHLRTISAADYCTWRNATWQHTLQRRRRRCAWRRGCDAIFFLPLSLSSAKAAHFNSRVCVGGGGQKVTSTCFKIATLLEPTVGGGWGGEKGGGFCIEGKVRVAASSPTSARKHGTPHDLRHAHPF